MTPHDHERYGERGILHSVDLDNTHGVTLRDAMHRPDAGPGVSLLGKATMLAILAIGILIGLVIL
jgi:hypothetical protein